MIIMVINNNTVNWFTIHYYQAKKKRKEKNKQ